LIGRKNRKTFIYKYIPGYGVVVAGSVEADAFLVVVADIVACNCVVAGRGEADSVPVVAGIVACNCVVAGRGEADSAPVVADIVACNCVVAGRGEADSDKVVVAYIVV